MRKLWLSKLLECQLIMFNATLCRCLFVFAVELESEVNFSADAAIDLPFVLSTFVWFQCDYKHMAKWWSVTVNTTHGWFLGKLGGGSDSNGEFFELQTNRNYDWNLSPRATLSAVHSTSIVNIFNCFAFCGLQRARFMMNFTVLAIQNSDSDSCKLICRANWDVRNLYVCGYNKSSADKCFIGNSHAV